MTYMDIKNKYEEIKSASSNFRERVALGEIIIADCIITNKELNPNEKMFLATYYCFDSNISLTRADAQKYINERQIKRIIKKLKKLQLLSPKPSISPLVLKVATIQNSHQGNVCEWCKKECFVLQKHHYPTPARFEGGIYE